MKALLITSTAIILFALLSPLIVIVFGEILLMIATVVGIFVR